jgi:hypothetical protein
MTRKITIRDIALHGTIKEAAQAFGCGVSSEKQIQLVEPTVESAVRYPGAFLAWMMDAATFGIPLQRVHVVADAVLDRYKEMAAVTRAKKASKKKPCATKAIDSAIAQRGLAPGPRKEKPWEEYRGTYREIQRKIGSRTALWKLGLEEML